MSSYSGTVRFFDQYRGYGFLDHDDFPKGVFVHISALSLPLGKLPNTGDEVVFEIDRDPEGRTRAKNVRFSNSGMTSPAASAAPFPYVASDPNEIAVHKDRQRELRRDAEVVFKPR